jgi:hypothetical protein
LRAVSRFSFTRLTNAFSKKLENLQAAFALHFAHYNLVRLHNALRITPAITANATDRVWALGIATACLFGFVMIIGLMKLN